MSDLPEPLISQSACQRISVSACELLASGNTIFQQIQAVVPLWGFGTLQPSFFPSVGSTVFYGNIVNGWTNKSWPIVYNKCTEYWIDSSGGTFTSVNKWTNVFNASSLRVNVSGNNLMAGPTGIDTSGGYTFVSCTSNVLVLNFKNGDGSVTGAYTLTLSEDMFGNTPGPFNPNDATYGWANLTAQAATLLTNLTLPAPRYSAPAGLASHYVNQTQIIFPVAGGTGYQITTSDTAGSLVFLDPGAPGGPEAGFCINIVVASANGLGVMIAPQTLPLLPIICLKFSTGIDDYPGPPDGVGSGTIYDNIGGVLVSSGAWLLSGAGVGFYPATSDHRTIYGQAMNINGSTGLLSMGSVISPGSFSTPNFVTASGTVYPNPVTNFKTLATFTPGDIAGNTGATYGMLGFRSTAW